MAVVTAAQWEELRSAMITLEARANAADARIKAVEEKSAGDTVSITMIRD